MGLLRMPAKSVPAASSTAAGCEHTATSGAFADGLTVLLIIRAAFSPSTTGMARSAGRILGQHSHSLNAQLDTDERTEEKHVEGDAACGKNGLGAVGHDDDAAPEALQHRLEHLGDDGIASSHEAVDRRQPARERARRRGRRAQVRVDWRWHRRR